MILTGKVNLPDGAKVDIILRDSDWKERAKQDYGWRLDNQTIFQDSAAVMNGKFECDIDLTDGPRFYPLKGKTFELVGDMNPRLQPIEVQDRIGWNGEGLDDKKYLDTSVPRLRKIHKQITLPVSEIE
jgi:hypothetical protein